LNLETFTLEEEALPKEQLVKKESKRAARCAPKPKPAEPKPAAPKPAEAIPAVPKAVSTVEEEDGMLVWTLPPRTFVSLEFVADDVPLVNLDENLMLDNVGQVHKTCVLWVEDDVPLVNLDEKLVLDKDGGVVEIKEPPQPPQPPQVPTIERVACVCCVCLLRASGARASGSGAGNLSQLATCPQLEVIEVAYCLLRCMRLICPMIFRARVSYVLELALTAARAAGAGARGGAGAAAGADKRAQRVCRHVGGGRSVLCSIATRYSSWSLLI
jgi:hypothetical protein